MVYDVVVVGGGISGLVAAYSLKKKGFSVLVLEKNKIPGGRIRTVSECGFRWDTGAQFLPRGYDVINQDYKTPRLVPQGKGFSLIIASSSFSGNHFNSPGDIIQGAIYSELAKIYPGLTQKVEFNTLQRWELAMPKFAVGYFKSLNLFKASQTGKSPFAFCGDYLNGPGVESAACSGLAAAEEVEKSLR